MAVAVEAVTTSTPTQRRLSDFESFFLDFIERDSLTSPEVRESLKRKLIRPSARLDTPSRRA